MNVTVTKTNLGFVTYRLLDDNNVQVTYGTGGASTSSTQHFDSLRDAWEFIFKAVGGRLRTGYRLEI